MRRFQSLIVAAILLPASATAQPAWSLGPTTSLSAMPEAGYDGESADQAKLIELAYANTGGGFEKTLISVYVDAQGPEIWLYDGTRRPARDVFATRSLDGGLTWTAPVNLAETAILSSIDVRGEATSPPEPYHGDSASPMLHANGKHVLVTWMDRYCPGGEQRFATYPESGSLEVPYACLYEARSHDAGGHWTSPRRLTSGLRDAWRNATASGSAGFAIVWQEDPLGLQPGEGEGPGEGGSGARVSPGTDIWHTGLPIARFGADTEFPPPRRVSDNFVLLAGAPGDTRESGSVGASRPQVALIDQSAVIAYEETKRNDSTPGKYIRYHWFQAFSDPVYDPTGGAGCILSEPLENARRARLISQPPPLRLSSEGQLMVMWRQGVATEGGPADIVARIGYRDPTDPLSNGFRIDDFDPPADPGCTTPTIGGAPPLNLSSSAGTGSRTDLNPIENARAHRAVVRGNTWLVAYVYTPNWNLAENTELENYDLFVRRSFDGGRTWGSPRNITQLPKTVSVAEPRLMGTPFSPDPTDQRNPLVHLLTWVEESATRSTIRFTRTTDAGETYEPILDLADNAPLQYEPQIRVSPDGTRLRAVWLASDPSGVANATFREAQGAFSVLDLDGDGRADALTDGVLILRGLFGFRGESLIDGAIGSAAVRHQAATVEAYLDRAMDRLDIDGNGRTDALTDGLLILRHLFGFQGDSLIEGAVGVGATRHTAPEIEAYLEALG